jgi:uncharacterized protein YegL
MSTMNLPGTGYKFSGMNIDDLGASEYTLVGIAGDKSSSVWDFRDEIEDCIKSVVTACRSAPRADNLMMRLTLFNSGLEEVHGFRPLTECDVDNYTNTVKTGGTTALFDASCNLVDSISTYGKSLVDQDFEVNGIAFVITDGWDNASTMTPAKVKESLERALRSEALESMMTILVGVNVNDPQVSQCLKDLKDQAGFTQYVELKDATASSLAKLADFVSKSISAQSQALGTGGPSQSLAF